MENLARLKHVTKAFEGIDRKVLSDVSLTIESGDFAVITGASGQGKSTLLNVMGGLLAPDEGSVVLAGIDLSDAPAQTADELRLRHVGFAFQNPYAISALTAWENLVFFTRKALGVRAVEDRVRSMMERYGLVECASNLPSQMSRGQLRRLSIARCLLTDAPLMLVDEPTNDLDSHWCDVVLDEFGELALSGEHAVVMVTHDARCVERGSKRLILDSNGELRCA